MTGIADGFLFRPDVLYTLLQSKMIRSYGRIIAEIYQLPPKREAFALLLIATKCGRKGNLFLRWKIFDFNQVFNVPQRPTATTMAPSEAAGDYDLTARWGIVGKGGITMPSNGRVERRPFTDDEKAALGETGVALLGPDTVDVYLNDRAYWKNVPAKVWEYTLGGYQVLKKWLSYREKALL
jgi:hypothetical protein